MNTPFNSHAWRELQSRAAAQLRPDFADHVLRCAQPAALPVSPFAAWVSSPFTVSAATAALCLAVVVSVHSHTTKVASDQHLADWQEISLQIASLDLTP